MEFSTGTVFLLSELDVFSGGKIKHRSDLGILLESGRIPPERDVLDELGSYSKFLHRAYAIMTRIGRSGEGYDRLANEFSEAVTKIRTLAASLIAGAPEDVRERFTATYLAMSQEGLDNLISLCRDISWYKNWLLDTGRLRKGKT